MTVIADMKLCDILRTKVDQDFTRKACLAFRRDKTEMGLI